jgi:hypothetical protein
MTPKVWKKPVVEVTSVRLAQGGVGATHDKTAQHAS